MEGYRKIFNFKVSILQMYRLNEIPEPLQYYIDVGFNTSNVSVELIKEINKKYKINCFNTSNVSVELGIKEIKSRRYLKFQYFKCIG